jgi:hypothetical protein
MRNVASRCNFSFCRNQFQGESDERTLPTRWRSSIAGSGRKERRRRGMARRRLTAGIERVLHQAKALAQSSDLAAASVLLSFFFSFLFCGRLHCAPLSSTPLESTERLESILHISTLHSARLSSSLLSLLLHPVTSLLSLGSSALSPYPPITEATVDIFSLYS